MLVYARKTRSKTIDTEDDEIVIYQRRSARRSARSQRSTREMSPEIERQLPRRSNRSVGNRELLQLQHNTSEVETREIQIDDGNVIRKSTRIKKHKLEQDEAEAKRKEEEAKRLEEEETEDDDYQKTELESGEGEENSQEESSEESESEEEEEGSPEKEGKSKYSLRRKRSEPDRLSFVRPIKEVTIRENRGKYSLRENRRTAISERFTRKRGRNELESTSSDSDDGPRQPASKRQYGKNFNHPWKDKKAADIKLKRSDLGLLGGSSSSKAALTGDMTPITVDPNCNFDSVGGYEEIKLQLKQMVILPILYPEFYSSFNIKPPKGCLFCGPPGTGKTLLARALASECQKIANQKVSVYVRNGADVLSKWVGESERQLRLLFEEAQRNSPAIIFFDEIDGLTPTRSSRQDHCHTSIVTTFLALLDGLQARGDIIVIGATNRVDMIDSALRRPGRFDTEFYFSLPDEKTRESILKIHTKSWKQTINHQELAAVTGGYNGADLALLVSEAAMFSLRRSFPQVYNSSEKLKINENNLGISAEDWHDAMLKITPSSQRLTCTTYGKVLAPHIKALLLKPCDEFCDHVYENLFILKNDKISTAMLPETQNIPLADLVGRGGVENVVFHKPRVLISGARNYGQEYMAEYFLYKTSSSFSKCKIIALDNTRLLNNDATGAIKQAQQEVSTNKLSSRAIIYLGDVSRLEKLISEETQLLLVEMINSISNHNPVLVLGYESEPPEENTLSDVLFKEKRYKLSSNSYSEFVYSYLKQVMLDAVKIPPVEKVSDIESRFEKLAVVPVKAKEIDPEQLQRQEIEEERTMVLLRQTLRDVLKDLKSDVRFRVSFLF